MGNILNPNFVYPKIVIKFNPTDKTCKATYPRVAPGVLGDERMDWGGTSEVLGDERADWEVVKC